MKPPKSKRLLYRVSHLCMLLNFIALVVTGVMRFTQPFSIAVTRVHMLCGLAVTVLIGFHIIGRLRQMKTMVKGRQGVNYAPVILSIVLTGLYLSAAWYAWPVAKQIVDLSYEARYKKEIFRTSQNVIGSEENTSLNAFKLTSEQASLSVEIDWSDMGSSADTDVAIWVETKSGSMIETMFLTSGLKYTEKIKRREGEPMRGDILPVWRNRYTAICGVDPDGKLDALSGPTKNHKFDLSNNLSSGEAFTVFVEINAKNDDQSSVIYAALIDPESPNAYTLLSILGTGKDAKYSGAINYNLDDLTTAKQLVDKILIHTIWDRKVEEDTEE